MRAMPKSSVRLMQPWVQLFGSSGARSRRDVWSAGANGERSRVMDYLVDAGKMERVRGVSERDAVLLTVLVLGDRAQFPIDVYTPSGAMTRFEREDPAA